MNTLEQLNKVFSTRYRLRLQTADGEKFAYPDKHVLFVGDPAGLLGAVLAALYNPGVVEITIQKGEWE